MNHRSIAGRRSLLTVAGMLTVLAAAGPGSVTASAAPVTAASDGSVEIPPPGPQPLPGGAGEKMSADVLAGGAGTRNVFVQMALAGAADAAAGARSRGNDARESAANQRAVVAATADAVVASAAAVDADATQLFEVSNAVPGIGLRASTEALEALAARADVVKISALVPKTTDNAGAAQLTQVLRTWQDTGVTGEGVRIGIIDTGVDYTHADFGGPGTVAAFEAADATDTGPFTPTTKVVGGHDFVGDDYNADPTSVGYQPLPRPDANPLDCNGHGTHVAGTAAGFGVNADGSTFAGDYAALGGDQLYDMTIGPGMAPRASLYALRVFGCNGSTDAVIPALDWSLDPNGDGDFSDHLDIVNLSLGSAFTPVDDPQTAIIDRLAAHGVLSVLSGGNAGDLTDAGGSPGNAVRGLSVASSVDAFSKIDAVQVDAPAEVAGVAAGQASTDYPWATSPDISGPVAALTGPTNMDGCDPLSASDAALVAGKVAWLEWDDSAARRCGSAARAGNVQAAGALGALFTSDVAAFPAGIAGSALIPVLQLTDTSTGALRPALAAGTLTVTFRSSLLRTVTQVDPEIADTLSTFSSRGAHGSLGVVKPDVAAPGQTVFSAAVGTGSGGASENGTSMAAPLTAGVAALVASKHPDWNPEQLKSAVMNTATRDVRTGTDRTGDRYGPTRVGSGRIDALNAVTTTLLAYDAHRDGAVSASFGVVEAPVDRSLIRRSRTVLVQNTGSEAVDVAVSYDGAITQPGVSYRTSPSSVPVPAGGSATVEVVMEVVPSELRRTIDPTMAAVQREPLTGLELARHFVSDASGWLVLAPAGAPALRVPVYGAAKPVSVTRARAGFGADGPVITLRGSGFRQGTGHAAFTSLVAVMDSGHVSPRLPRCNPVVTTGCIQNASARSGDLHHIGVGATRSANGSRADGWLYFGLSTWHNWATVGHSSIPFVDIDTTGDGEPDFVALVQFSPGTDILMSRLYDLNAGTLIDVRPVNFSSGSVDTNVFDTNTVVIPVWPAMIGVTDDDTTFPITYTVSSWNLYAISSDRILDTTPPIAFDVVNPRVQVRSPLWLDRGGVTIPYTLSGETPSTGADTGAAGTDRHGPGARGAEVLLLHLHGASGHRSEVIRVR